jgi:hypothetical protein
MVYHVWTHFPKEGVHGWWHCYGGHFGDFFFKDNFRFKPWEYLFPQPSLVEKKWLVLVDGRKKETKMDVYSSFERMEVNKDNVGSLKS